LVEARAKGLALRFDPAAEEAVMEVSELYTDAELRYMANGQWTLVPTHLVVITLVQQGSPRCAVLGR
jgi:hypothetical protein